MTDLNTSDAEFDALTSATEERATLSAEHDHATSSAASSAGRCPEGLEVKLDRGDVSPEELTMGRYVVARGRQRM